MLVSHVIFINLFHFQDKICSPSSSRSSPLLQVDDNLPNIAQNISSSLSPNIAVRSPSLIHNIPADFLHRQARQHRAEFVTDKGSGIKVEQEARENSQDPLSISERSPRSIKSESDSIVDVKSRKRYSYTF